MIAATIAPDSRLQDITRVLVERVHPELVLLFGSRARGSARDDSDFDLMIVVRDQSAVEASRKAAYQILRELPMSVDVLARSVDEYVRHQCDPGFMDWMIARDGLVLYTTGMIPQWSPDRVREPGPGKGGVAMWMRRAASDMNIAEHAFTATDPSVDAICFHAHAAVEKWLKALIVVHTRTFPPKTHDLEALLVMQPADIRENAEVIEACALLMVVYPKSRYAEDGMPSGAEAHEAVAAARAVRAAVAVHLPL